MRSQERADMSGQMGRPTRASGRKTRCMATESSFGRMAKNMKATSSMISVKVKVNSHGRTVEYTMASGRMESNTDVESSSPRTTWRESENGKTEERSSGSTESL